MTKKQKMQYAPADELRAYIQQLDGRKFRLDCGHHVTFGAELGNSVTIQNGGKLHIVCAQCGY